MIRELRNAALAFGAVFAGYGLASSTYLAGFGFTYDQHAVGYVLFSAAIYAAIGLLMGVVAGAVLHASSLLGRARLRSTPLELAFHLLAATGLLYALHAFLRLLSGYVFVHWEQSNRGPQLAALAAVALAYGVLLLLLRFLLARRRREGAVLAVSVASILGVSGASLYSHLGLNAGPVEGAKDNVFVISVDTLRSDYLPVYGDTRVRTPAIDSIARDGVVFEQAFATSPYTWPSLSSFLTGRFTLRHGVRRNGTPLPDEEHTLVELFREKGYGTAGTSDIGLRWLGFDQGFDELVKDDSGIFEIQPFRRMTPFLQRFSNWFVKDPGRITSSLPQTLAALRWIRTTEEFERSFFWFHYYDDSPHAPYTSPEPYHSMHVPAENTSRYDGNSDFVHRLTRGAAEATPDDRERIRALYAAEITWCDRQIGALLRALKQRGLYESATIVILSDHGEMFGRRGYYTHGEYLFNEAIKVPLIIKPPSQAGFRAGARVERPVSLTDVLPTLTALYGLDEPEMPIDGHSLLPFLQRGTTNPSHRFWHYAETLVYARSETDLAEGEKRVGFAVLNDDWKSIHVPDLDEYHLYRLQDAQEQHNLADRRRTRAMARSAMKHFGFSDVAELLAVEDEAVPSSTRERLEALGYVVD